MGLWSTIKGWFNIGGVKVLLWKYTEPLSLSDPTIKGAALLKTKSPKEVVSLEVRVVEEHTYTVGEGDDKRKETDTTVLGAVKFPEFESGVGYPLALEPGKDVEQPFDFFVAVPERLAHSGGVAGGLGKMLNFASGDKFEYFLVAEAKVKGAAFATQDKQALKIGK